MVNGLVRQQTERTAVDPGYVETPGNLPKRDFGPFVNISEAMKSIA